MNDTTTQLGLGVGTTFAESAIAVLRSAGAGVRAGGLPGWRMVLHRRYWAVSRSAVGRKACLYGLYSPEGPEIDRELLLAKADGLDVKIKELTSMRDRLRHAAVCQSF